MSKLVSSTCNSAMTRLWRGGDGDEGCVPGTSSTDRQGSDPPPFAGGLFAREKISFNDDIEELK